MSIVNSIVKLSSTSISIGNKFFDPVNSFAPKIWNSLPNSLRLSPYALVHFEKTLKVLFPDLLIF